MRNTYRPIVISLSGALLALLCLTFSPTESSAFSPLPAALETAGAKKRDVKPITINNVRYYRSAGQTRLVFDLARPIKYSRERSTDADQVIISLSRAVLSNAAKQTLVRDGFPREVRVKQAESSRVQVILVMDGIRDVKLQTLAKPHRLVLDYAQKPVASNQQAAATEQEPNAEPDPQPTITLPPVTRPITQAQRQARLDIDTIVLDPGHGGKDPGAIGRGRLTEKEVVLDVAMRLRNLLRDRLGKKVLMTRETDNFIELDDRARFANAHKAELFVSIHINSHPKNNVRGFEMYHFGIASDRRALQVAARENGDSIDHAKDFVDMIKADLLLSKRIEESQNLAWETKLAVVNRVSSEYRLEDHGVKTAPFYVLRYTAMPSILAELSFISNTQDEKNLRTPTYRQKMAEGLFEGIRNYLNSAQVASARIP